MRGENAARLALNQSEWQGQLAGPSDAPWHVTLSHQSERTVRRGSLRDGCFPFFSEELSPSAAPGDVCTAVRGLSNFVPLIPIAGRRCPRGGHPSVSFPVDLAYTGRWYQSQRVPILNRQDVFLVCRVDAKPRAGG